MTIDYFKLFNKAQNLFLEKKFSECFILLGNLLGILFSENKIEIKNYTQIEKNFEKSLDQIKDEKKDIKSENIKNETKVVIKNDKKRGIENIEINEEKNFYKKIKKHHHHDSDFKEEVKKPRVDSENLQSFLKKKIIPITIFKKIVLNYYLQIRCLISIGSFGESIKRLEFLISLKKSNFSNLEEKDLSIENIFNEAEKTIKILKEKLNEKKKFIDLLELKKKIPITIITGFLGSGKTTLLNQILTTNENKEIKETIDPKTGILVEKKQPWKFVVIENEFGTISIDDKLIKTKLDKDKIYELTNGCICCTGADDLISTLVAIYKKYIVSNEDIIDAVFIETTGLADPSPISSLCFSNDFIRENFRLDSIITIVDSKNILSHLNKKENKIKIDSEFEIDNILNQTVTINEAEEQIAFADVIILNKIELVKNEELQSLKNLIFSINSNAKLLTSSFSNVDLKQLLGIKTFSIDKAFEIQNNFMEVKRKHERKGSVNSISILDDCNEINLNSFINCLKNLLSEKGDLIYRGKGILNVKNSNKKYIFQSVHNELQIEEGEFWEENEKKNSKLVFIGKDLDKSFFEEEIKKTFEKKELLYLIKEK
jgi:G3E family GTPase